MHILLFGKNGQVGWELQRALLPLGRITAVDFDSTDYCGDFSNPKGVAETVRLLKPDVIVNAAAHTAVDKAESERDFAELLNATSVAAIAKEAEALGSRHLIFRTSWVYAARGANFAKTMLRFGKERSEMSVINDQFGAPTGAELLADCTAHAIRIAQDKPEVAGLYHLIASGTTTWFDYAQRVFATARAAGVELAVTQVNAVPTSAFPTPAKRPHNSRLDTSKFQRTFGMTLPDWTIGVDRMLAEILGK